MKTCFVVIFFFLLPALTSLARSEAAPRPEDHLVPFRTSIFDEFRPSLYKKLLLTPGNYGRMIEFAGEPNRGEFAVSVQCGEGSGTGNQCAVTLTKAKQNLGSILVEHWGKRPLELIDKVSAVRKDAPIGAATASAIRAAWTKFLRSIRQRRPIGPNDSVVVCGERIEFFIGSPTPNRLFGEVPDRSGPSIIALVELGRSLAQYCEAPENQRAMLAAKIELAAKRLAGRPLRKAGANP